MNRASCRQIEELLFEYSRGELNEEERSAVAVHLAICEACKEAFEICDNLPQVVAKAEMRPLCDESRERALNPSVVPMRVSTGNDNQFRKVMFAAGAAASIAAVILFVFVFLGISNEEGSFSVRANDGLAFEMGPDETLLASILPGTSLRLGPGADAEILESGPLIARFNLESGYALAEIGPVQPGFRFIVQTPGGEVEARGTVFSVSVSDRGEERVVVSEGRVEVRGYVADNLPTILEAGQEIVYGDTAPSGAAPGNLARDLALVVEPGALAGSGSCSDTVIKRYITLAQEYRRGKMFDSAAVTYQRLVDGCPDNEVALNSLVALGQMKLVMMGRPTEALTHFEAYLERHPDGTLASVARAGKARCKVAIEGSQKSSEE